MSFNQCTFHGNLTTDPELKNVGEKQTPLVNFSVAVTRKMDRDKTDFINCQAWGKLAELIDQHFAKGKPIIVSGELQQDRWEDQDGKNRSRHILNVRDFAFCDAPKSKQEEPVAAGATAQQEDIPF